MMTVAQVKAELPGVRVRFNGRVHNARVTGRKCEDACVTILADPRKRGHENPPWADFHFSWAAVARAVNGGRVLHAD